MTEGSKPKASELGFSELSIVACPICGSDSFGELAQRADGIKVLRCENCSMGFVESRPVEPQSLYGDSYFDAVADTGVGYLDYESVASHSLSWVIKLVGLLAPQSDILDVGCANGYLLRMLGSAYQRFGVEPNLRMASECREAGIDVIAADICDLAVGEAWANRFDVITATAVLEHVPDMRLALEQIRQMLRPGGVLIFETPFVPPGEEGSIWFRSSLEHIFYPNLESLTFIFREVFALPLIGRQVQISNYGSTFVGLATKDPQAHAALISKFDRLMDSPISELPDSEERNFRFFFDLVYAAKVSAQALSVLPELPLSDIRPRLLNRLRELWGTEVARSVALQGAIENRDARELAELHESRSRIQLLSAELERSIAEAETLRTQLSGAHTSKELRVAEVSAQLEVQAAQSAFVLRQAENQYRNELGRLLDELANLERGLERYGEEDEEAERLKTELAAVSHSLAASESRHEEELRRLLNDLSGSQEHVTALLQSTSWRLTGPARWVIMRLRAVAGWSLSGSRGRNLLRTAYHLAPLPPSTKRRIVDVMSQRGVLTPLQDTGAGGQKVAYAEPVHVTQQEWPVGSPLISVVIPAFNYGHFVAGAVDSVLSQTFDDLEVIVVEGGSTDPQSAETTANLVRPKTTILYRDAPRLLGDNRNFGIAHTRGKYICCLDADDLLNPTYLEKALFLLETQGFDVVSSAYELFGDTSGVYRPMERPALPDLVEGNHVAVCGVFRRSMWEEVGGYADTGLGEKFVYEDWRFWVRLAARGARFTNIVNEPLFRYRVHSKSLSRSAGVRPYDAQRKEISKLEAGILTQEAFERSKEHRRTPVKMVNPLLNLWSRSSTDERPTIVIALPFLMVGGAERLMSEISAHLSRCGYRILIITHKEVNVAAGDSSDWFTEATREIYHLPRFLPTSLWREFVSYLFETRNVKVVWIAGSQFFYDLLGVIRSRWPSVKVIDLLFNVVGHTASNRNQAASIDLTVVENTEVEQWLLEKGEAPERVLRIPSGVNLKRYQPVTKSPVALADLKILPGAFIVGFSGRLSEEKMPETFVKLVGRLRHLPELAFVMTGSGPMEATIRRQIDRLGLGKRLLFVGNAPDVRDYLGIYDVLIVPSRLDGRPMVVLESLAMGVPVIASRVGGLPELVTDGKTGFLCDPSDLDSFIGRVLWMSEHPEEVAQMKMAARAYAESELDAGLMHARYEEAVGRLTGRCSDRASSEAS